MNNREIYNLSKENFHKLTYSYDYKSGADNPYKLGGLNQLRDTILEFSQIPFLKSDIEKLKEVLLSTTGDSLSFSSPNHTIIDSFIKNLKIRLSFL